MRFLVMVKATRDSEAGVLPDERLLAEMAKYNTEGEIEIRQVFELADFGAGAAVDHHARLREQFPKT